MSSSFSSYSFEDIMIATVFHVLFNVLHPLFLRVLLLFLVLYWWSPVTLAIQLLLIDNRPRKCTDLFSTIATMLLLIVVGFVLPIWFAGCINAGASYSDAGAVGNTSGASAAAGASYSDSGAAGNAVGASAAAGDLGRFRDFFLDNCLTIS